ncbi:hypothetical protein FIA58_013940 [Flavobacterium jejuense]|uniref:Uncharacterized protein n=1 Tax=Flavobacterium jejuense TaxID=1544455 RepID=A0ABX0ISD7_9FLAO|nr:hypothetical protein [Flavobacterium jejuense]NHN26782.1 hypothetical protein [Flavobacterium jejuense]
MIFKIKFSDKIEYAQAKGWANLFEEYTSEYGQDEFNKIECISNVSETEAKNIKIVNPDYNEKIPNDVKEFSLYDLASGDYFCILGSTEWD